MWIAHERTDVLVGWGVCQEGVAYSGVCVVCVSRAGWIKEKYIY